MSIYLNDVLVQFGRYPNGEAIVPQLDLTNLGAYPKVRLHWEDDTDLVKLLLVRGALEDARNDLGVPIGLPPALVIDYMPYSRMDRSEGGSCFSLEHVAMFIQQLHWRSIAVVEPHSSVTLRSLGAKPLDVTTKLLPLVLEEVDFSKTRDYLVLPDEGAVTRYQEQLPELFAECNIVVLSKTRDFATGKITGLEVNRRILRGDRLEHPGAQAVIIDDLCSRGGTFIGAAGLLRAQLGCENVYLLVTHMETAGVNDNLAEALTHVFCTDTMLSPTQSVPYSFTVYPRSTWA